MSVVFDEANHHESDVGAGLEVLQSFNAAIQADSSHQSQMGAREVLNIIAVHSNGTGSLVEHASIQNMLLSNVGEYNQDTDDMIALNIQTDINEFTNGKMLRDLDALKKQRNTVRNNVSRERLLFLSKRYSFEQNSASIFAVQLAFWMESLVFLILTLKGAGYLNSVVAVVLVVIIVGSYGSVMYGILKQNADRRTDVFNKFYWSATATS